MILWVAQKTIIEMWSDPMGDVKHYSTLLHVTIHVTRSNSLIYTKINTPPVVQLYIKINQL